MLSVKATYEFVHLHMYVPINIYPTSENPQPYPPTQPPPSYGVDQYQHTGAQPVQVNLL